MRAVTLARRVPLCGCMSKQHHKTYDDLVRADVPLPDSSYRPSKSEVIASENREPGPRIDAPDVEAIRDVLVRLDGADLTDLDIQIDGGRATLEGSVAREEDRRRILQAVQGIRGIAAVIDLLRVRL